MLELDEYGHKLDIRWTCKYCKSGAVRWDKYGYLRCETCGQYFCGGRRRMCHECGRRYIPKSSPESEYDIWNCPECGAPRECRNKVDPPANDRNSRCKFHNKDAKRGMESHLAKTGNFSTYAPARISQKLEIALKDRMLFSMREHIGLLDARIMDLLEGMDIAGDILAWKELKEILTVMWIESQKGIPVTVDKIKAALRIVNGQLDNTTRWQEVYNVVDLRRKTSDSEAKRMLDLKQTVTVEGVGVFVAQYGSGIMDIILNDELPIDAETRVKMIDRVKELSERLMNQRVREPARLAIKDTEIVEGEFRDAPEGEDG